MLPGNLRRWMLFAPILMLLPISALVFSACGDDDDSGGNNSGGVTSSGSGSDTDYVKSVCVSFNKYVSDFSAQAAKDPTSLSDPTKAMKIAAPILSDLADSLSKAKPPKDVKSYHDGLVKSIRDVAQKAKDGKINSLDELSGIGDSVGEPSQDIQDRLSKAADGVTECNQGGGSLFSGN